MVERITTRDSGRTLDGAVDEKAAGEDDVAPPQVHAPQEAIWITAHNLNVFAAHHPAPC